MRRKVIKQGNGTLTVTLPKQWTKEVGLSGNDEVEVQEKDHTLLISKKLIGKDSVVELRVTKEVKRYIRSLIGRLYVRGYSRINITFDDPDLMNDIRKAVNDLIGADILDFSNNRCVVKMFSAEESGNLDKNFIKMFNTLQYMVNIIQEDIKKGKFNSEETLNELRNNNWKAKDYVLRNALLHNVTYEEFGFLNNILFIYEKIGTNILAFYRMYLVHNKVDKSMNFKKIHNNLDWFLKVIAKKGPISPNEESKFRKEIRDSHIELLNKKVNPAYAVIVYFVNELLDSSVSYLSIYKSEV